MQECAFILRGKGSAYQNQNKSLTILVQLEELKVRTQILQQLLAGVAVRAVRLGENNNGIVVDEGLGTILSGGHDGGCRGGEGAEETLEKRNGGRGRSK